MEDTQTFLTVQLGINLNEHSRKKKDIFNEYLA